ncbi:type II toxin-antitoxin system Phd/YefM family antitoxin [Arthrobacter monumenti]
MSTIPHRQLRNESSKILQRVKNGETVEVTNNGDVAAVLVPPSSSPFERRLLAGHIRPAAAIGVVDLITVERVPSPESTAEILADVRGDR